MTVYLVGAGPGDPGLITVRGAELLARADVVFYDRLSAESLLALAPQAERVAVGKTPRGPSVPQDEINAMLVERGLRGQHVVRLKGGDPYLFGRGGEEAEALAAAGVAFEVVPGVSALAAVPAYAGVPVTHRGLAKSITVVTGQGAPWASPETDWDAVARVGGTIVAYMSVAVRDQLAARLIDAGLSATTPVAAITWGTTARQSTLRTTLGALGAAPVRDPAIIVIGAVAALDLRWFEDRPLFGTTVVVPRSQEQANALSRRLRELGADVIETPTIAIEPGDAIEAAELRNFDWVAMTSPNAVGALFAGLRDARDLGGVQLAAVGPGTADALRARGVEPDLVPTRNNAEGLLESWPDGRGHRVLLPQSSIARPALAVGLRSLGHKVDVVVAYRTTPVDVPAERVEAIRRADAIAFTSSSTCENFVASAGAGALPASVIAIGPATAETAAGLGVRVDAIAEPSNLDGLVAAVVATIGNQQPV